MGDVRAVQQRRPGANRPAGEVEVPHDVPRGHDRRRVQAEGLGHERDGLVADLLVGQPFAVLVADVDEQGEHPVAGVRTRRAHAGDLLVDALVDVGAGPHRLAPQGSRQPPVQADHVGRPVDEVE
jgi:hypothetical protein